MADVHRHGVPVAEAPTKVFTVREANLLLPTIEGIFREMDHRALRLREVGDLAEDVERYWGDRVHEPGFPDRDAYDGLVRERADLEASLADDVGRVHALGAVLKDVHEGLVDFYGDVGGQRVFLCWRRGEPSVAFYHTLEGGFAGRRPLAAVHEK